MLETVLVLNLSRYNLDCLLFQLASTSAAWFLSATTAWLTARICTTAACFDAALHSSETSTQLGQATLTLLLAARIAAAVGTSAAWLLGTSTAWLRAAVIGTATAGLTTIGSTATAGLTVTSEYTEECVCIRGTAQCDYDSKSCRKYKLVSHWEGSFKGGETLLPLF